MNINKNRAVFLNYSPKKSSRLFPDSRLKIGVFITPPFGSKRIGPLAPVISVVKIASRNLISLASLFGLASLASHLHKFSQRSFKRHNRDPSLAVLLVAEIYEVTLSARIILRK